jgi:hypothetical protein
MRGSFRLDFWSRCVLSLIVLTANIGAPFRTSAVGRVLLESLRQDTAPSAVVRVRAASPVGTSQGFRAVVGLAKGGPDEPAPAMNSHTTSAFFLSSMARFSRGHGDHPLARPNPFLRC